MDRVGASGQFWLNNSMRFCEFSSIKPIKPLNPAQYAIASKKRQVDQAKDALKRETDAQKRKKEQEAHWNKLRKGKTIPA